MPEDSENLSLEKRNGAVPAKPLQGEVLPAFPFEIKWYRRRPVLIIGSLWVLSLVTFFISDFLQMRGVINVMASRVCLYLAAALLIFFIGIAAYNVKRWRAATRIIFTLCSLGILACAYKVDMATLPSPKAIADLPRIYADDPQFRVFNLTPKEKAQLDVFKAQLFRDKSEMTDTGAYDHLIVLKNQLRDLADSFEAKHNCLLDMTQNECWPKPPPSLQVNGVVGIHVGFSYVAAELLKNTVWIVKNQVSKLRVPILLSVTITDTSNRPVKVHQLYLEARDVHGWADARMADSIYPDRPVAIENDPLLFCARNACASLKGEYLVPSLYDRVIQPKDTISGWVAAEYPKGFKYGTSIGEMRISLAAEGRWIGTKVFTANPPTYGDYLNGSDIKEFYTIPLDTLLTEDQ